jgi:hypothetical protein
MPEYSRTMKVTEDTPVTSRFRQKESGYVPAFNFPGKLRQGVSGFWPVTNLVELSYLTCTASAPGQQDAAFSLLLANDLTGQPQVVKTWTMLALLTSIKIRIDHPAIPQIFAVGQKLFVASYRASGHMNIVIQCMASRPINS